MESTLHALPPEASEGRRPSAGRRSSDPSASRAGGRRISLLDADPDLTTGLPDHALADARRALTRPVYEIPAGRWTPRLLHGHDGDVGLLVLEGAVVRRTSVAGRECDRLLGPGDVVRESSPAPGEWPVAWHALQPTTLFALDDAFTRATRRWPVLGANLHRRLLAQVDDAAVDAAIAQLPRIEHRLLAMLSRLATRWGHVTPFGLEVHLELTHAALGRLVGARRPTVTLALVQLAETGAVTRSSHGGFLLRADPGEALGTDPPLAPTGRTS